MSWRGFVRMYNESIEMWNELYKNGNVNPQLTSHYYG